MPTNHTAETLAEALEQAPVRVAALVKGRLCEIGCIVREDDKVSLYLDVIPVGWDGVAALMPPEFGREN